MGRPLRDALLETPGAGDWLKKVIAPLVQLKPGVVKKGAVAKGEPPTSSAPTAPKTTPTPKQEPTKQVQVVPAASAQLSMQWPKGFDPEKALKDFDPNKSLSKDEFLKKRAAEWEKKAAAYKKPEKWTSAGGVVLQSRDDTSKVLVIKPSNNYGPWAFPKGRVDEGETYQIAAVREVWEETGVKAKFLPMGKNTYLGHGEGTMSVTHFFLMYKVGGHPKPTDETEKALFVPWDEAINLFTKAGNKRDVKIALKAMSVLGVLDKK
jgi:ADP-ribose pyrophosphatase YjhB (NUDIX family)